MPEISQRAELMPASPIRKLVPLAEAARARGTKIYHLNIGQPDLPSPQTGLDALKKIDRTVLEYSPSDGYRSLREKLVGYYEQFQIKLSPDDIIVTTGGSEAVLFAFMSCLNPGDEIIVPEPAYANYMAFAISAGAVIRPVVSSIEQGFALPDVAEFEKLINDRTRGILICNPNNPTGYLYTRKEMNRIRDLVKKYDLFLFSDEVYREFIYTGSPYISACHLEGIEQNVVLIDSVSKRYSECGIRIGALITKNRTLRNAVMKFCQARLSPPPIGHIAADALCVRHPARLRASAAARTSLSAKCSLAASARRPIGSKAATRSKMSARSSTSSIKSGAICASVFKIDVSIIFRSMRADFLPRFMICPDSV